MVFAQPVAASHLAIHPGDASRGGPHQRDSGFGDGGVAVAPDQMNCDAQFAEFFRVHVAAGAGPQKHHVLEPHAFARDLGRQRGVIDHGDLCTVEHARQVIRSDVRVAMNAHAGIIRPSQPFEDERQRFIGVDKNSSH